ncbi:MAG: (4Fe-4S)-binding protein, partial [Candidatus Omnitrophica bacterium]|nr:(4Fe-4S)-binding protein [Candidatus Omnitrophota bacterium]
NDLKLAVGVLRRLSIPFGVFINRADLGNNKTDEFCVKENIPVLMKMPFKREIAVAYSKGESIVEAFPEYKKEFARMYERIKEMAR